MNAKYLFICMFIITGSSSTYADSYNKGYKTGYKAGKVDGSVQGEMDGRKVADAEWKGSVVSNKAKTEPTTVPVDDYIGNREFNNDHEQQEWVRGFTDGYKSGWTDVHQIAYVKGYNYAVKILEEQSRSR
ncbi:MAG TPA: hypothetical protein VFF04_00420 [Candidatus Babeliales bacterium]|nr:hypothetical protein [Candidatus Babeliales bacterium]